MTRGLSVDRLPRWGPPVGCEALRLPVGVWGPIPLGLGPPRPQWWVPEDGR